jgi:4-carboxymuconolactone decarboxylase
MAQDSLAKARQTVRDYMGRSLDLSEDSHDEFLKITVGQLFGDVWGRPGLAWRERCLITVTIMIVQGRGDELHHHMQGARRLGFTLQELEEVCLHLAYYVGFPGAHAAVKIARGVFAEGAREP